MKNFCITFFVLIIIIATVVFAAGAGETAESEYDYLRIHVRANSNSEQDQAVKYEVKDAVVEYLTPVAAECTTKERAIALISENLEGIEAVCNKVLRENGFSYTASAEVHSENFPTRVYGDLTLESGLYDALIIELGTGEGDNWWCVIYPPLCFTSSTGSVTYRSAILDIINKFLYSSAE